MEGLKYFLALAAIRDFGPAKFKKIITNFHRPEEAWRANLPELLACGFSPKEAEKILAEKNRISPEAEEEKMLALGISAITIFNEAYPENLKEIYNPPAVLFYRGDLNCLKRDCLAVVGARTNTAYGQNALEKIVKPLAQAGITIISGLALGTDALAHRAALEAGGLTAAVLGSDLDWQNIGPKTNSKLAEKILENDGCLLSEFPIGTAPNKSTFPQRNRLISGLAKGILIIEAGENSGSLITAACGLEQNREIFAVPGGIFSAMSRGANNLIKKGATAVTEAEDILAQLCWQTTFNLQHPPTAGTTDELEKIILEQLSAEPLNLDKLSEICKMGISVLNSKLMMLELNGSIKKLGNGSYIKIN